MEVGTIATDAFATIQEAINAAAPGSTIQIAPGQYDELLTVGKSVTLDGAGKDLTRITRGVAITAPESALRVTLADLSVIAATSPQDGDSYYGVRIDATAGDTAPVTLSDVSIRSPHVVGVYGTGILIAANGHVVDDVEIRNAEVNGSYTHGMYVRNSAGHVPGVVSNLSISDSSFDSNDAKGGESFYGFGLYIGNGTKPATLGDSSLLVDGLTVTDTSFRDNWLKGIYVESLSNATFDRITVEGNGVTAGQNRSATGIDINLKFGNYSNIQFLNSTIANNGTGDAAVGAGLAVKARDDGATYGAYPATLDGVTIRGTTVSGSPTGVVFGEPGKANAGPTGVEVGMSRIVENIRNVASNLAASSPAIDATNNWWGTNDGPALNSISGDVTVGPWLVLGITPSSPSVIVGQSLPVFVDLNHNSQGEDVSGLGHVPDGIVVAFGSIGGSMQPPTLPLLDGSAESAFLAGWVVGGATVTATLDGQLVESTISVSDPLVVITGAVSVDEGAPYTLSLSATGAGTITGWTVDLGDGTVQEIIGDPSSANHVYASGPASRSISAVVHTTSGSYPAGDVVIVEVRNVAPTSAILGAPASVVHGSTIMLSAAATDPGPGPTQFRWTVLTNGATFATGMGSTFSFRPLIAGTYSVRLDASDRFGGTGSTSTTILVTPVLPPGPPLSPSQQRVVVNIATRSEPPAVQALIRLPARAQQNFAPVIVHHQQKQEQSVARFISRVLSYPSIRR